MLTGTSFALAAEASDGGLVSLWGRGAVSRFDGREGDLSLDGEVARAMLGADWARDVWTTGLLLAHSRGGGGYRGSGDDAGGTVRSTVTGLYPYGRYRASERVTLWGVAGYGTGTLTLTPKKPAGDGEEDGQEDGQLGGQSHGRTLRADLTLTMAAVGVRDVAVEAPSEGGFKLAVRSDAMAVRTTSEKVASLAAGKGEATRVRLGLEGSWRGLPAGGGELVPRLDVAARHDGGDAERGFGLDLGGGVAWSHAQRGLSAEVSGRGLVTHQSKGFRDTGLAGSLSWDPGQGSGLGPKLALTQTMGSSAAGGMDALLGRETLAGLAANDNGAGELANRRLDLKLGYGFPAFGDRFTSTPHVGLGLSNGHREYTLGWRLSLIPGSGSGARGGPNALGAAIEARRRETANDNEDPEHGIGFRVTARW